MRIGMICYPSVGGSGVVATELGKQLARRGHEVHFISSDMPFRLTEYHQNIFFHQVETPAYPVFKDSPYVLSLAGKIVSVAKMTGLDVIHAHYAVPHATAAYLAREMLGAQGPKVITTLHGTDITLMAAEPNFAEVIAFSINSSDAVTAVSRSLQADTYRSLNVTRPVRHIPNFLDCGEYRRAPVPGLRERFATPQEKIVVHMSNMRRVKRVDLVVEAFAQIAARLPAKLLLIGDGPELCQACQQAQQLGIRDRIHFLGNQEQILPLLSVGDLFLLPSEQESFGLAALEAMACGVPVVATRAGGIPEVVADGETGLLVPVGDAEALANAAVHVLRHPELHQQMSRAARERAHREFCADQIVAQYEAVYQEVLGVAAMPAAGQ